MALPRFTRDGESSAATGVLGDGGCRVAEARAGEQTLEHVAAKHSVTKASLKYRLYKKPPSTAAAPASAPRVLPIRVERQRAIVEAQLGSLRVTFCDSCDPLYVAAVLSGSAMLTLPASVRIYHVVEPVDLRHGHDGMSAVVQGQWRMDLFGGHLFVFLGRRRDRCKILFWDRGGLVLYYISEWKKAP